MPIMEWSVNKESYNCFSSDIFCFCVVIRVSDGEAVVSSLQSEAGTERGRRAWPG